MDWLLDPQVWASLLTLTLLEIVLGIDNLIFLSILVGRLPLKQQARARQVGLALALGTRLALLAAISWIMRLTAPLVTIAGSNSKWPCRCTGVIVRVGPRHGAAVLSRSGSA